MDQLIKEIINLRLEIYNLRKETQDMKKSVLEALLKVVEFEKEKNADLKKLSKEFSEDVSAFFSEKSNQ